MTMLNDKSQFMVINGKLTDSVIILSNSITGGMWKSKTKYCRLFKEKEEN